MDVTNYWNQPTPEQQIVKNEIEQEAKAQEPGQVPVPCMLAQAFNAGEFGTELVACASGLFIIIVQDRCDLGGGYGVQILALDQLVNKHFDELEHVETYLAENLPYKKHAPVWLSLLAYHSGKSETEYLKRFLEKEGK